VLHLHQVAQGTFTPRLPDMPGTQDKPLRGAFGILDPFRALREPERRRRVEEQAFPAPIKEHDKKGLAESSVQQ